MRNNIDIWSKGEVANYLVSLAEAGQVKRCIHLMLEYGHANAFYPMCNKDWASREAAPNVSIDITAYTGPSSYSWPKCPDNCPHYSESDDFLVTVSKDQYDEGSIIPPGDNRGIESQPLVVEPIKVENQKGNASTPAPPEKVTVPWLLKHVPVTLWGASAGILFVVFLAGIKSSQLTLIQEIFDLKTAMTQENDIEKMNETTETNKAN